MNTEQIRKEFEAWATKNGFAIKQDSQTVAAEIGFEGGYKAAAKSRDELIGKLAEALKHLHDAIAIEAKVFGEPEDNSRLAIAQQALAEAKAQGYGE